MFNAVIELFFPRQRYNFESNSQQVDALLLKKGGCFSRVKDTILKAIHNLIAAFQK